MVGKQGRVTGRIGPGRVGEVMIPIRGGTESFYAYSNEASEEIDVGARVIVVEYYPPRTVYVVPAL
jgi:hypothetical protein